MGCKNGGIDCDPVPAGIFIDDPDGSYSVSVELWQFTGRDSSGNITDITYKNIVTDVRYNPPSGWGQWSDSSSYVDQGTPGQSYPGDLTIAGAAGAQSSGATNSVKKRLSGDDGANYTNQTSAARAILQQVNSSSIKENREYCGNVCKDKETGTYFTTGPVRGSIDGCAPSQAVCPLDDSHWVAYWHSHGAFVDGNGDGIDDYLSEEFSEADMGYSDRHHVDGYLGTPTNQFLHYPYGSGSPYSRGGL